jgi:hypothetical protein
VHDAELHWSDTSLPNTHNLGPARFENLRAVGAFLVSATYDGDKVTRLSLYSEKGKTAKLVSPWAEKVLRVVRGSDHGHVQVALKDDWQFLTREPTRHISLVLHSCFFDSAQQKNLVIDTTTIAGAGGFIDICQ